MDVDEYFKGIRKDFSMNENIIQNPVYELKQKRQDKFSWLVGLSRFFSVLILLMVYGKTGNEHDKMKSTMPSLRGRKEALQFELLSQSLCSKR